MKTFLLVITGVFVPLSAVAFNDIPEHHPYKDSILYGKDSGIVSGYQDGSFKPDTGINRAEFIKIIVAATTADELPSVNQRCFPDVPTNVWFARYVCAAKRQGLVKGYPSASSGQAPEFKPGNGINFVEAAKILFLAYGGEVDDGTNAEVWFQPYVEALAVKNAIPSTIYRFGKPLSRGEMMAIIHRLRENITDQASTNFRDLPCTREDDSEFYSYETAVSQPYNVCELFIESQGSVVLDDRIGSLQNLRTLLISHTNISTLPSPLWKLPRLTELQLFDVGISTVPADIGFLTGLKRLDLRGNSLTSLPPELQELKQLEWLGLGGNPLPTTEIDKVRNWLPKATISVE